MSRDYTTDPYGNIAVPNPKAGFVAGYVDKLPYILGEGTVRRLARELADAITEAARAEPGPVVWLTGNAYMPAFRSFPAAEYVWNAENNEDGELFAFLAETVEDHLARENVVMECPEWDNALYCVDLNRWQHKEPTINDIDDFDDFNDEWEPVVE